MDARRTIAALVVLALAQTALGDLVFDDGGYHVIDYAPPYETLVVVRDSLAGEPTTVEFTVGLQCGAFRTYGSSRAVVEVCNSMLTEAWNDSEIIINNGNGTIAGYDNSSITFFYGQITGPFRVWGSAHFAGGTVENWDNIWRSGMRAYGDAQLEISGGTIKPDCFFQGTSQVHISGGDIQGGITTLENSHTTISGGYIRGSLYIGQQSTVTLEGHSFVIDGQPAPYGTYYSNGYVTGTLADGKTIYTDFMLSDSGTLTLAPKPGDANGDGSVDGLDYVVWSDHYGECGLPGWPEGGWAVGNFNSDECVDGLDYIAWSNNYEQGCPSAGQVPEPSCALVLILGICALRRRRHGA